MLLERQWNKYILIEYNWHGSEIELLKLLKVEIKPDVWGKARH